LASSKESGDTDSLRALYELFFYAEKLVIKWSICNEYNAKLKSKNNFVETVVDYAMKLSIIEKEILNKNLSNENVTKDNNLSNKEEIVQTSDESNNSETTDSISFSSLE
jgi:hypothetical protein